jgi:predicted ATP-grasp superfamily ATP-dependent carboligase
MFTEINFTGLVMIEIKFFNNQHYIIEANPRLWGPSQLIIDAGMDLFKRFAIENSLISNFDNCNYTNGTYYFWQGGISENNKMNLPLTFYNQSEELLQKNIEELRKNEIFLRQDSINIHILENTN